MKRLPLFAMVLLVAAALSGCARAASPSGAQRSTNPGMADAVGPTGMSRDSKAYLAADPP